MNPIELIATAAFGLEAIVEREVQKLGFSDTKVEDGRVRFKGDVSAICKANLWLRSADRVLLVIGEFHCPDFEQLFERTKEMPWEDWLPVDATFPVYAKSVKSMLTATPSLQRAVKKAIVERLKTKHQRIWFEENGPEYPIEISLLNDRATLTIDTSGEGLHKRGYRQETTEAPLKETLAAALVQLSYWNRDRILVDPCCGSGTIPIEAALIARNMPPGGDRSFAAELWPQVPMKIWTEARKEARDLRQKPLEQAILASDMDPQVIRLARKHANDAGVGMDIHFERKLVSEFKEYREYGCMIVNPPYGERMGDRDSVDQLNVDFGDIMQLHPTWSFYFLSAHPAFERLAGRPADRRRKLYNGRIECTYYQYQGPRPPREAALAEAELLASVPLPPLDFKPLKSPTRGPAVGRSLDEFVTTTPLETGPEHGLYAPMHRSVSGGGVSLSPSDFKPMKPPTRGPAASRPVEESGAASPLAAGPAQASFSGQPTGYIPLPPSEFKPLKPPTRGPLATVPVVEAVLEIETVPVVFPAGEVSPPVTAGEVVAPPDIPVATEPVPAIAHESVAAVPESVSAGVPQGVPAPSPDVTSEPVIESAPVAASMVVAPAGPPVAVVTPARTEVPSAIAQRMKTLDFKPNRPPQRGPLATEGSVAPVVLTNAPAGTSGRVIPSPPPGFKPLKPPVRTFSPVPPVVTAPPVVASVPSTSEPLETVAAPLPVPVSVDTQPTGLSLVEMAARATNVAESPVSASPVKEVIVDW